MIKHALLLTAMVTISLFSVTSAQAEVSGKVKALYEEKIKSWVSSPEIISAIKAQNEKHAGLSQADIDELDKKWRADDAAVIDPILHNPLSTYLTGIVEQGGGLYSEIFVMDDKGLNVGQSSKTSDFWQGDEAKFQETYGVGDGAMHASEIEFDESSQMYQLQLSVTVSDAGVPIGAVTIGLNAEDIE